MQSCKTVDYSLNQSNQPAQATLCFYTIIITLCICISQLITTTITVTERN